jgi:hypothetical protein
MDVESPEKTIFLDSKERPAGSSFDGLKYALRETLNRTAGMSLSVEELHKLLSELLCNPNSRDGV